MKKSWMIVGFVFLMAVVVPGKTFCAGVELAVGAWEQSPAGQLAYKELTDLDILDLEDDLGYDDETRIFARLKIDMPSIIPNVHLMATPMEFDGIGQKNVNFKFGDEIFQANADFFSEIKLDHLDLALYYGLPFIESATADTFNIDLGINIRLYDFEGSLTQSLSGLSESESFTAPVPMVYVAVQIRPLEKFSIEGEARGLVIGDDKGYSLIGRLKWKLLGPLFAAGGYRYDKIDIEEDDFTLDIDFSGLFAEAGFVF